MKDEKELIEEVRYAYKNKVSRAEITRRFQKRGYKLEYINAIIKQAKPHGKWFYISLTTIVFLIIIIASFLYLFLFQSGEKLNLTNPLKGLNINFGEKSQDLNEAPSSEDEIYIEDVVITAEFISYLLNEIGAYQLHPNPLTREKPIINFKIESVTFNSIIDDEIKTYNGLSSKADIQFETTKENTVKAMLSEEPANIFKTSLGDGSTQIVVLASETELFAKGYLGLYEDLK